MYLLNIEKQIIYVFYSHTIYYDWSSLLEDKMHLRISCGTGNLPMKIYPTFSQFNRKITYKESQRERNILCSTHSTVNPKAVNRFFPMKYFILRTLEN